MLNLFNLPKIIITNHIFIYLENVDKICFLLATKKFYQERNSFPYISTSANIYNNVYLKSFNLHTNTVFIGFDTTEIEKIPNLEGVNKVVWDASELSIKKDQDDFTFIGGMTERENPFFRNSPLSTPASILTNTITHLTLYTTFDLPNHFIPNSVTTLALTHTTPQQGLIPSSVTDLTYRYLKRTELQPNVIPNSVIRMTVDFKSAILPGALPDSIKYLKFTPTYKTEISDGIIPSQVETLIFMNTSTLLINENTILPESVTSLTINSMANKLPPNLRRIELHNMVNQAQSSSTLSIPPTLNTIVVRSIACQMPQTNLSNLTSLKMCDPYSHEIPINSLPPSLTKLSLSQPYHYDLNPGTLPPCLIKLKLLGYRASIRPNVLPSSLRILILGRLFNQPLLPNSLPVGLEKLILKRFNQPLEPFVLGPNLNYIDFGTTFNRLLNENILPNSGSLLTLKFGSDYSLPFKANVLPNGLEDLTLGIKYTHDLIHLPPSVRYIRLDNVYVQTLISDQGIRTHIHNTPFQAINRKQKLNIPFFSNLNKQKSIPTISSSTTTDHKHLQSQSQTIDIMVKNMFVTYKVIKNGPISNMYNYIISHRINFRIVSHINLNIRFISEKYALVLTDELEGGFVKISQLKDLSFWKEIYELKRFQLDDQFFSKEMLRLISVQNSQLPVSLLDILI